jgi:hypothetical protein
MINLLVPGEPMLIYFIEGMRGVDLGPLRKSGTN